MARLLKKFGPVVDVPGLEPAAAAGRLAAHEPAGIIGFLDATIPHLAAIAGTLSLPYHRPETAARLVDKLHQRQALREAGIGGPAFFDAPAGVGKGDVREIANQVRYPAVLKPRRGAGSRDTFLVTGADELLDAWVSAGEDRDMLVEEYLPDGPPPAPGLANYLSVESLVSGGRISHLAVTGRFPMAPPFRETGFFVPGIAPAGTLELATAGLEALGVELGCFHTEIKLTPHGPCLIEINGRLGGGAAEMVELASGVGLIKLCMRVALGETFAFDGLLPCERVGYRFLAQPPQDVVRVKAIEGLDRLDELAGVSETYVHHRPGDAVDWRRGTSSWVFQVYGSAPGLEGLLETRRFIEREVRVEYEP
jgi:biotin carboxylase